MGNYAVSDKLNVILNLPYIETNASAGSMGGQNGLQDIALTVKYMPFRKIRGKSIYSLFALGSFSAPVSNYPADYLPLSIGLRSKTAALRLMSDYQRDRFFSSLSGSYVKRANIEIDRNVYYTTKMYYTSEVTMPDAISVNLRIGYRTSNLIVEAILDNWVTQSGGFDITTNNMPFPSNTMNTVKIGLNSKYTLKKASALSINGGCNFVTDGRNIGQSSTFYSGLLYVVNFKKHSQNEK